MTNLENCEFLQMRSSDDEAAFFALMGRFFASATVRHECGGYPLSDGPRYRWFIVRRKGQTRVLGFISLEQHADMARLRDGYLRAEARGQGLFRALRQQVLDYIDGMELDCMTRLPQRCVPFLLPHGFQPRSTRGRWVTLIRSAHGKHYEAGGACRGPVPGAGWPAPGPSRGSDQPDTSAPS